MNILVFSSAMRENDFSLYQEEAKIKPNPSNQNFYYKLIKTLAINNTVSVVSQMMLMYAFPPISRQKIAPSSDGAHTCRSAALSFVSSVGFGTLQPVS